MFYAVDFVLGESKRADMSSEFADKNKNCEGFSNSDLSSCRRKCPKLTNLHITNICLLQIHDLWYNSYRYDVVKNNNF